MIRGNLKMPDVELAKLQGEDLLKKRVLTIRQSFSYEETAYHLPVSYALTGVPVHDRKAALDVYSRTGSNPLVASESILAEMTAGSGKEPAPIPVLSATRSSASLGIPWSTAVSLVLPLSSGPRRMPVWQQRSAANCRKNTCSPSLPARSSRPCSGAGVRLGLEYRLFPSGQHRFTVCISWISSPGWR